ncbi:MAG: hypothetical protein ABI702_10550 [Burkholderiales bacterium]
MIVVTLVEGLVLLVLHHASGRGVTPRDFLLNMISGLCLMLALRALVRDAGVLWIALCLLAAGVAHVTDLWMRWQRGERVSRDQEVAA